MNWSYRKFDDLSGRDVYEILRLRVGIFIVEQACPYYEVDGKDYESIHICCEDVNGLAAYTRLLPAGVKYNRPSIGRVAVREDVRGIGLAHTLMERSVDYVLREWKPEEIQLQAQTHLAGFYESHGFIVISEPYEDDGIPHVDMIYKTNQTTSF